MPLEKELAYYDDARDALLSEHEGKFVLIVGESLAGVFDSSDTAYEHGLREFGNEPFLIKQVVRDEPPDSFPALHLGLLNADP